MRLLLLTLVILFNKNSRYTDPNHKIDINIEEVVAYIRKINDANLTMNDIFNQLGKARDGYVSIDPAW